MRNLFYLIIFFVIIGCSNNKVGYWCGDHPCINKNEKEAYFKKTMIVEIKELKKKTIKNNSEIEKITEQARLEEKRRIKEEKDLAKQARLEEKRRIKEEKDLTKKIERDEKRIINKKKIKPQKIENIDTKIKNVKVDKSNFRKLVEKIIKKNSLRPYPDINDIPN